MKLRLGYKASAEQFGPIDLLRAGVFAEECGFDSVLVSDHLQPWRHNRGHAANAIAYLSALGARTERIVIGTSVLTPTMRYHPGIIAQAFGTLGTLFPQRVILGVGTGEAMNEQVLRSEVWPTFGERFARLKEAVNLIQVLWREDRVSYSGTYYSTHELTIYDRPLRPVPIYVAAGGSRVAEFAGAVGDGVICTSGKGEALYSEGIVPGFAAGIAERRNGASEPEMLIEVKVSIRDSDSAAREDTRFWSALALSAAEKAGIDDPLELEARGNELPLERVVGRWIAGSDPALHIDAIGRYVELGFRHLVFHSPDSDQLRFLATYSKHVLPELRARFA